MKRRTYVPPGGAAAASGAVLTRSDVKQAVRRFARRHGYSAPTVRTVTTLFRRAVDSYSRSS